MKKIIFLVRVEGESGWPALVPGKTYWASGLLRPRVGDFIVFRNPKNVSRTFVKRVKEITPEGYWVEGLVSGASSSEDFGVVPKVLVLGRIIFLPRT